MDIWLIGVLVVLLTILWRVVSSWLESRSTPAPEPYQVGGLTPRSLQLYNGYDFLKPILVAVQGVLYDVTDLRGLYGPGKELHVYAGRECSRALAKDSTSEVECNDSLQGLTPEELDLLEAKLEELKKGAPAVGKVVPMASLTLEELQRYNGSDPALPMYISVRGTVFDVTQSKMYYGPDGVYPFAGREVARAFALNSLELSDCHDDLSGLTNWDLDNLKEWEYKFCSKYHIIGSVVAPAAAAGKAAAAEPAGEAAGGAKEEVAVSPTEAGGGVS